MAKNGCGYGQVTRTMVEDIKSDIGDIKKMIISSDMKVDAVNEKAQTMFNHLSNRAPPWATTVITILAGLLGVALGKLFLI